MIKCVSVKDLGPALQQFCEARNDTQLEVKTSNFYFPDGKGISSISARDGGHYLPVPDGMEVSRLCDEINSLVRELGIEKGVSKDYWIASSTDPSLDGQVFDRKGKHVPQQFKEYLECQLTFKVAVADEDTEWGVYTADQLYYVAPYSTVVDFLYVEGKIVRTKEEQPLFLSPVKEVVEYVCQLLKGAYKLGASNTEKKMMRKLVSAFGLDC